jgi:hypothetical protein
MNQFKIISKRTVNEYIAVYKNGELDEDLTYTYNGSKETGANPVSTTTINPVTLNYTPNISVEEIKQVKTHPYDYSYEYDITYSPQELNFDLPVTIENNGKSLELTIQGKYKESIKYDYVCGYSIPLPDDGVEYIEFNFDYDTTSTNYHSAFFNSYKTKYKNGNNTGITSLVDLVVDTELSNNIKFKATINPDSTNLNRYKVNFSIDTIYQYNNGYTEPISETICFRQADTDKLLCVKVNRLDKPTEEQPE